MASLRYDLAAIFQPTVVDPVICAGGLACLICMPGQAALDRLESVFYHVMVTWQPPDAAYQWFFFTTESPPGERFQQPAHVYDQRRMLYWFWSCLAAYSAYTVVQQRALVGTEMHSTDLLLTMLHPLPFLHAINTWLAICIQWLEHSNIDWYRAAAHKAPATYPVWKSGEEAMIPRLLAGMMATIYY